MALLVLALAGCAGPSREELIRSQQTYERNARTLFDAIADKPRSSYRNEDCVGWADIFTTQDGQVTVRPVAELLRRAPATTSTGAGQAPALDRYGRLAAEKLALPVGTRHMRVCARAEDRSPTQAGMWVLQESGGGQTGWWDAWRSSGRLWLADYERISQALQSEPGMATLSLADVQAYFAVYRNPQAQSRLNDTALAAAARAARLDLAAYFVEQRRSRGGPAFSADSMRLYTTLAIAKGSFDDVIALADTGDAEAIQRALQLAASDDQKQRAEVALGRGGDAAFILARGQFDSLIGLAARGNAEALARVFQVAVSPEQRRSAQQALAKSGRVDMILQYGDFDTVMTQARSRDRAPLKRAYDLAVTQAQKRQVEGVLVERIRDKLLNHRVAMEGTGQTRASDVNIYIARQIETNVRSSISYQLSFDPSIFVPAFSYRVKGRIRVRVEGKFNGERNCGLLWMSKCAIVDEPGQQDYEIPVQAELRPASRFTDSGTASVDWKSVSGGSGISSGLMMGGTRVFSATGVTVELLVDAVESQP